MEKRDLYDSNRNFTGETIFKGDKTPEGRYIIVYIKIDIEDIKKLKLQNDEVEDVEWFSESEIMELMKQDKFFKNHYEEFEILIDWLKNK